MSPEEGNNERIGLKDESPIILVPKFYCVPPTGWIMKSGFNEQREAPEDTDSVFLLFFVSRIFLLLLISSVCFERYSS